MTGSLQKTYIVINKNSLFASFKIGLNETGSFFQLPVCNACFCSQNSVIGWHMAKIRSSVLEENEIMLRNFYCKTHCHGFMGCLTTYIYDILTH